MEWFENVEWPGDREWVEGELASSKPELGLKLESELEDCDVCHGSGKLAGAICPECGGEGRYDPSMG